MPRRKASTISVFFAQPQRKGSPSRGAGAKRLRDCCHKFAAAECLRRPNLFPCAGKDWGEKGAWGRGVHSASEFRQASMLWASFHSEVTLRASWYAPPDTGVSSLILVAVERLPSIEGALETLMGFTFLRGSNLSASLCSAPPLHKGRLMGCVFQGSPCQGELARSA